MAISPTSESTGGRAPVDSTRAWILPRKSSRLSTEITVKVSHCVTGPVTAPTDAAAPVRMAPMPKNMM